MHLCKPSVGKENTHAFALPHEEQQHEVISKDNSAKRASNHNGVSALQDPGKKLETV